MIASYVSNILKSIRNLTELVQFVPHFRSAVCNIRAIYMRKNKTRLKTRRELCHLYEHVLSKPRGRDPFNQNFRKFRSKTQWIGSVQPEKFRKNGGGPLFPVGPVGILVEWIAPEKTLGTRLQLTVKSTFFQNGDYEKICKIVFGFRW